MTRNLLATLVSAAVATGCLGQIGDGGGSNAGNSSPDAGTVTSDAGGGTTVDTGGAISDPFAVAPTCTSGKSWTNGNHGDPEMNPGRACIACHTSGEGPGLSIAGTVYPTAHEPDLCNGANGATGVRVVITGADGRTTTLTPNAVGNFRSENAIALPYQAKVTYMGRERAMATKQSTGDCNGCHTQTGANAAPGRILLP